ncbi:hypothetical protein GOBAR_AA10805 [Gossypium barbadense]|uniref:Uncharacterized protein n=1 Tax=Gossypium barbadense TaxID=3634 RepID=A0A2P5Y2P9_GOSBA|nr:hypothetical protein GOBAR_AA10805 [Gossypium barbadense]
MSEHTAARKGKVLSRVRGKRTAWSGTSARPDLWRRFAINEMNSNYELNGQVRFKSGFKPNGHDPGI